MTQARTFAVVTLAGLALVLTGCGTEDAPDGSLGSGAGTTVEPEAETPTIATATSRLTPSAPWSSTSGSTSHPAEYPLPDAPTEAEVTSVAELGEVYSTVPGIDEIVADLEGTTLGAGERLFVYLVNACTTDEVALAIQGTRSR